MILLFFFSILLHANMLDWSTCSALANVWLRTTQTATIHEYAAVVELYVINVLEPQERWEDVTAFLESCKNLPANIVTKLLQESHARKQEFMATQVQRNDDSTLEDNSDEIIQQRSQLREQPSLPPITQYSDVVGQNAIRFYFIKPFSCKFHIDDCISLTAFVNIFDAVSDIMASHLTTAFQWFVKCISKPSRKTYSYGALCLVLFYLLVRKTRLGGIPNALLLALWTKLIQLCTYCLRLLHIVN